MRKLKIIWLIISLCVLLGGIVWLIVDPSWTVAGIWYGACIVVNLPTFFAAIKEDATGSGKIVTFLFCTLIAPLFLLWNVYYTFKYM